MKPTGLSAPRMSVYSDAVLSLKALEDRRLLEMQRWTFSLAPKKREAAAAALVSVRTLFSLTESRFRIYPRAHVLIGQEAGVGGQGIVGKNGVVVGGAGAGCVLAGWGVLFERRRQVQVLEGNIIKA